MKKIKVPSKVICVNDDKTLTPKGMTHCVPWVVKGTVYAVRGVDFMGSIFICGLEKEGIGQLANGKRGPRGLLSIRFMAQTTDMIEIEVEDTCPGVCLPPPLPRRNDVVKAPELKMRKA